MVQRSMLDSQRSSTVSLIVQTRTLQLPKPRHNAASVTAEHPSRCRLCRRRVVMAVVVVRVMAVVPALTMLVATHQEWMC